MRPATWRAAAAGYRREPRLRFNDVLLEGAAAAADAVADELEQAAAQSSTLGQVPTTDRRTPTMSTITLTLTAREADTIKRALATAERQAISSGRRASAANRSSYAMTAAEFVGVRRKVEEAGR